MKIHVNLFISRNVSEDAVYKMSAMLSRPQHVLNNSRRIDICYLSLDSGYNFSPPLKLSIGLKCNGAMGQLCGPQ